MQTTIQQIKMAKSRHRRATDRRESYAFQEHDGILKGWLAVSEKGMFIVQDGRIKECNRFLSRMGGYPRDEVLDTVFASFFDSGSIPIVESACGAELPGTRCSTVKRVSLVCKDGQRVKVQLKVHPCVFGEKPATLAVLSRVLDSTRHGENGRAYGWLFAPEKIPLGL
jgi:PAS domain S-box-containing protein